jgi:hypothetical protein
MPSDYFSNGNHFISQIEEIYVVCAAAEKYTFFLSVLRFSMHSNWISISLYFVCFYME